MPRPHLLPPLTIAPGADYWRTAAAALLAAVPDLLPPAARQAGAGGADLSGLRVVVPTFFHGQHLRNALADELGRAFVAPRLCTLQSWLALQPPAPGRAAARHLATGNERLMALYAELRQHAWLKKLFAARRNTDLLPLAQTLLALADELTAALWPAMEKLPATADARWEAALAQLPPTARAVLSEESQLVWSIWKSQLDADDPAVDLLARMRALAATAASPLVWFAPMAPDPITDAFLQAWSERQPVLPVVLDWRARALPPMLASAWPELMPAADAPLQAEQFDQFDLFGSDPEAFDEAGAPDGGERRCAPPVLAPAANLEEEAQAGAQTIVNWLVEGKTSIAIVAQDRVVARRIRALLQRASVSVSDETGWKLSTTRAASALAAWFDLVTSRAESTVLLDFLKSPFLLGDDIERAEQVMTIELALRRANVAGGWRAVMAAVPAGPARAHLAHLAEQAGVFRDRHTIAAWLELTRAALDNLGIGAAFEQDAAGLQVKAMLEAIGRACGALAQEFSFAEWRAYVALQLEATAFLPPVTDRRVVMLPLNGTHLRSFDAVLLVGADAGHLPSVASETLFFANAVRRELGLPTREARQLQQLRDFAELVCASGTLVLSWQAHRNGEPNPVSNWVARLELALARSRQPALAVDRACLPDVPLQARQPSMPSPVAPAMLPQKLSASGFTSLTACPYQFFATRMLGLSGLDELSEQLEKRDYGDWLHQILHLYHTGIRDQAIAPAQRGDFMQSVTQQVFGVALAKSAAALGYHDRWQKALPAYLAWAATREAEGWEFVAGEEWREHPLRWRDGEILLHGRIDRIDRNAAGDVAVLDYKTSSMATLKKRIDANEDHQLAFYGLLSATPTLGASYVSLEPVKAKIGEVDAPGYAERQQRLQQQIGGAMQAIADGAGLRASGIETACRFCDVRGLCRKGAW